LDSDGAGGLGAGGTTVDANGASAAPILWFSTI